MNFFMQNGTIKNRTYYSDIENKGDVSNYNTIELTEFKSETLTLDLKSATNNRFSENESRTDNSQTTSSLIFAEVRQTMIGRAE